MTSQFIASSYHPSVNASLPSPDQAYQAHSLALSEYIVAEIANTDQRAISFARFMELALYAPGLGYYVAGKPVIGASGDFVTAPDISPLFGDSLSVQIAQILQAVAQGVMLECGAGKGTLAAQLLNALALRGVLPETYYILEPSPALKAIQQETLKRDCPAYCNRVVWLDQLPEAPLSGVILANEVIDAMPVHRVCYDGNRLCEYFVRYQADQFQWQCGEPSTAALTEHWQAIASESLPRPYTTEINLFALAWLNSLNERLKQGAMLFIDYGFGQSEYYHPSRDQGTLLCHYQHLAHADPFWWPGLQDITAHVDFTALACRASTLSLQVAGFIHQAGFLLNCGLTDALLSRQQTCETPQARIQLNQQVQQLTAPQEMGESFKVMALTRDLDIPLIGFKQYDQQHRL